METRIDRVDLLGGAGGPAHGAGGAGLKLADLIDASLLQTMMDDFHELTHMPIALIELDGDVVVGSGWQDVCTRFHRVDARTCAYCVESDTVLTEDIPAGEAKLYRCRNGMWDAATPILAGSERVGNLFTGQFFFDDEPVDMEFFRSQAERYGFDVRDYLSSVEAVPRLSRTTVDVGIRFLTNLSNMLSRLNLSNLERARAEVRIRAALDTETALAGELEAERNVMLAIMENTDTHLAFLDPDFNFVAVNSTYAQGSGHTPAQLIGRSHFELFPNEENQAIFEHVRDTGEPARYTSKPFEFPDQPWRGVTYWDWRLTPVRDRDSSLRGFAFSLQDVTQLVRQRTFSDALNGLNDVIHGNLDFGSVLAQFVPQLAEATRCEVVTVALRSAEGDWRFAEVFGLPTELKDRVFSEDRLPVTAAAMRSGRPTVFGPGIPSQPATSLAGDLGIQSLLVAPLSVADEQLGAISYGYLSGPGGFDEFDVDFAGKVASSLSLALNNSRLFHDERHAARLSGALATVNEILLSTLTLEDVLARLVGEASLAAGADKSLVVEVRGGEYTVTHVRDMGGDLVGQPKDAAFFPVFALAAAEDEPVLIDDNWTDPRTNKDFVVPHGLRSFQLLPLTMRGAVTHVLALAYDRPQSFDEDDRRSAERMASAMSAALENARLFENEHRVADHLQEALLALPDAIPGVAFAHAYHSAAEAARVGGDFYDIFEVNGDLLGVTIGDVAGKGLDAAVLTSLAKNAIRAHALETGKTPKRILALTNDVVYRATVAEAFVTLFFGLLDLHDGRLVYASGGHTTAAVIRADGGLSELHATGPLLGAFEAVEFEEAETRLDRDDVLFLYTAGVTEARSGGQQYGEETLFSALSSLTGRPVAEVVQGVVDDVVLHTGDQLEDDLAILAVSRVERPEWTQGPQTP